MIIVILARSSSAFKSKFKWVREEVGNDHGQLLPGCQKIHKFKNTKVQRGKELPGKLKNQIFDVFIRNAVIVC